MKHVQIPQSELGKVIDMTFICLSTIFRNNIFSEICEQKTLKEIMHVEVADGQIVEQIIDNLLIEIVPFILKDKDLQNLDDIEKSYNEQKKTITIDRTPIDDYFSNLTVYQIKKTIECIMATRG